MSTASSRARCDYPLHLGLTEAGMGMKGIVASTAGLVILLDEGIGDTIRVSLTPEPGGDRTEEVLVAQQVLQSLGLRSFLPQVWPAPAAAAPRARSSRRWRSASRATSRRDAGAGRRAIPGVEEMHVAVMGCVVNGPGESKHADIGICLPGTFEEPVAPVFVDGALRTTLRGEGLVDEFIAILDDYVERRYGSAATAGWLGPQASPLRPAAAQPRDAGCTGDWRRTGDRRHRPSRLAT